jgi:hypothetical protein
VYIFLVIIIISSIFSTSLQNSAQYDNNINIKFVDNILRVLAGAAAGGLLTILVLNHTTRIRANHSYKAIIWRLVELSGAAYVDILGNYGHGEFVNSLFGSGFGPKDGRDCINEIICMLKEKARQIEKVEYPYYKSKDKNDGTNHIYGYYKYDRASRYVEDLTNIYYRDAINNTTDKYILEELYRCTDRGLILIGLFEGDFKQSAKLWSLAFFLELNMNLYRILLGQLGVNVEKEIKVTGAKA